MLPQAPFTMHGGCNCKAIRYRVSVPPFPQRPGNPYKTPGADIGDLRIPMVAVCHCNDCRRATASILPHALVTDISTVAVSVTPLAQEVVSDDEERSWRPAAEVFDHRSPDLDRLHLKCYRSSPGRSRWFCGSCGTNIGYSIDDGIVPAEWHWPKMLDIWLGTVDREDIEKEYMSPERQLWCEMGVPWIRRLASQGLAVPEHPLTKIDKIVGGDDVSADLRSLEGLGK